MVDFIAEEFDVEVSIRTIQRMLKQEKISRKQVWPIKLEVSHL
jgi:transposase